jgi:hypothetical protein
MLRAATLLLGLLLLGRPLPARAQVRSTLPEAWAPPRAAPRAAPASYGDSVAALRRARPAALVGGVLGSALGLWAGLEFGDLAVEQMGWTCCGDDPGMAAHVTGAVAGSVLGAVLGVTAGTQAAGQRPADVQRRLAGAIAGLLVGGLVAGVVESATQRSDRPLMITSFAVGQGLVAGIIGTAHPSSVDSTSR